jgi:hypothetical protein
VPSVTRAGRILNKRSSVLGIIEGRLSYPGIGRMSEREQLEQSIINQCLEPDGLLFLLRCNRFDNAKYQELIQSLTEYAEKLNNDLILNRRVAAFLRLIESIFSVAVIYHDRQAIDSETGRSTKDAHGQIVKLMDRIFDVNLQ